MPTEVQWGDHSVGEIAGALVLDDEAIAEVPDGGFDACPYMGATGLFLNRNEITVVGSRAFARLGALTYLMWIDPVGSNSSPTTKN